MCTSVIWWLRTCHRVLKLCVSSCDMFLLASCSPATAEHSLLFRPDFRVFQKWVHWRQCSNNCNSAKYTLHRNIWRHGCVKCIKCCQTKVFECVTEYPYHCHLMSCYMNPLTSCIRETAENHSLLFSFRVFKKWVPLRQSLPMRNVQLRVFNGHFMCI